MRMRTQINSSGVTPVQIKALQNAAVGSAAATPEQVFSAVLHYARIGLWAMPVYAFTLGVGSLDHQPPPQTDLADWSRFVTTDLFLFKHLIASTAGSLFLALGAMAFGVVLMQRGSIRLGLWGLLTGVAATVITVSVVGDADYAQPAIGRLYLAGHHDLAQSLYYDAGQGTPMVVMAVIGLSLLIASVVIFGVAVARSSDLPRLAGIGFATSIVLFALIGFLLDNWIQSVATALMLASSVWIVIALRRQDINRQEMKL